MTFTEAERVSLAQQKADLDRVRARKTQKADLVEVVSPLAPRPADLERLTIGDRLKSLMWWRGK